MSELCPCGSGRPLDECCGPYLEGKAWPDDADTMVRSRFSAYCLGKFDYLVETTHPAYREDLTAQMLEEQTRDVHWLRLDMKLMFSVVANSAAQMKSPSFSRSGSSVTRMIFPCLRSSSASGMVLKFMVNSPVKSRSAAAFLL